VGSSFLSIPKDEEPLGVACNTYHLRATATYYFTTQLCAQI